MIKAPQEKWKIQIICIIVAIGLWFAIISEQNPISEGTYTVPVVVEIWIRNTSYHRCLKVYTSTYRDRAIQLLMLTLPILRHI